MGVIGYVKGLVLDLFASLRKAARDDRRNVELERAERAYRKSLRHLELYIALADWRDGGY